MSSATAHHNGGAVATRSDGVAPGAQASASVSATTEIVNAWA
jgi:hypothetical protein